MTHFSAQLAFCLHKCQSLQKTGTLYFGGENESSVVDARNLFGLLYTRSDFKIWPTTHERRGMALNLRHAFCIRHFAPFISMPPVFPLLGSSSIRVLLWTASMYLTEIFTHQHPCTLKRQAVVGSNVIEMDPHRGSRLECRLSIPTNADFSWRFLALLRTAHRQSPAPL